MRSAFLLFHIFSWLLLSAIALAEGDRAVVIDNETDGANLRWDLIENEHKEIFAGYFIWEGTKVGGLGLAGLRDAARRGVKVRLLIDGAATSTWDVPNITPPMLKALQEEGIEVRIFHPIDRVAAYLNPTNLQRLHDKVMYFGGQNLVDTSDRNFHSINFSYGRRKQVRFPSFRSAETLVQSDTANLATRQHLEKLWETARPVDTSKVTSVQIARAAHRLDVYEHLLRATAHHKQDWTKKLIPVDEIHAIGSETDRVTSSLPPAQSEMADIINKTNDEVTMTLPFYNLLPELEAALVRKAKDGKIVNLVVPSHASSLRESSFLLSSPQLARLEAAGVHVWEHQGPHPLHIKLIESDSKVVYSGTDNFNPRSAYTDTESGFVISGQAFGENVHGLVQQIMRESKPFSNPPFTIKEMCLAALLKIARTIPLVWRQF